MTFCIAQVYYCLSYLVQLISIENVLRSHRDRGMLVSKTTNTYIFLKCGKQNHISPTKVVCYLSYNVTTMQLWCSGHSTSIIIYGVWGVRARVQISKKEFHTHIYLD